MCYLIFIAVKCYVKVCNGVTCFIAAKHTCCGQSYIFNEPPPLSLPIFIHISLAGITPLCQVSRPVLHWVKIILSCVCLDLFQEVNNHLNQIRNEGAPLSSSPPEGRGNEKRAISPYCCLQFVCRCGASSPPQPENPLIL